MSKREAIDYLKLCSNYYANYEDGTCMESCEYYNHNECPVVYVNGLITELKEQLALTEKALALAVETMRYELGEEAIKNLYKDAMENLKDNLNMRFDTEMCDWYKTKAKEIMKNE